MLLMYVPEIMMTEIHFFEGKSGIMERGRHYIFQLSLQRNPEETKRYVEACFGKSIYSQEYQEKIERKLCVGNHKNCHFIYKGNLRAGEDGLKESETEKNRIRHIPVKMNYPR